MNEKERKKVKFSLTKFTKKGSNRTVGFGEIDDENLYTKSKIYEDCISYCHKVLNTTNEFKGSLIIAQKTLIYFIRLKYISVEYFITFVYLVQFLSFVHFLLSLLVECLLKISNIALIFYY